MTDEEKIQAQLNMNKAHRDFICRPFHISINKLVRLKTFKLVEDKKYWNKFRLWYVGIMLFVIFGFQIGAHFGDHFFHGTCEWKKTIMYIFVPLAWWIIGIYAGQTILRRDE